MKWIWIEIDELASAVHFGAYGSTDSTEKQYELCIFVTAHANKNFAFARRSRGIAGMFEIEVISFLSGRFRFENNDTKWKMWTNLNYARLPFNFAFPFFIPTKRSIWISIERGAFLLLLLLLLLLTSSFISLSVLHISKNNDNNVFFGSSVSLSRSHGMKQADNSKTVIIITERHTHSLTVCNARDNRF